MKYNIKNSRLYHFLFGINLEEYFFRRVNRQCKLFFRRQCQDFLDEVFFCLVTPYLLYVGEAAKKTEGTRTPTAIVLTKIT